jgi:hypothetical protein
MRKSILALFAICGAFVSANAGEYVLGMNFVVSHTTTISAIGANDGGVTFSSGETVGIISDLTGNLVGPEVFFGPASAGTQSGDFFFENITPMALSPGDYSIISLSSGSSLPGGGGGLAGGNSYQDLGNDVSLPGGNRFNSGAGLVVSLSEAPIPGVKAQPLDAVDPPGVPDGGATAMLLGASLAVLRWARRKF